VEIVKIEMREIFASSYKYYESHPLGKVVLRNNTGHPVPGRDAHLFHQGLHGLPDGDRVPEIGPKQEMDLMVKPCSITGYWT